MLGFEVFHWCFQNKLSFTPLNVRSRPRAVSEPAITTHGRAAAVMSQAISRAPTAAISPVTYLSLLSFLLLFAVFSLLFLRYLLQ